MPDTKPIPDTAKEQWNAAETPWEDLRAGALKEYEDVSSKAHSWSSVIPRAINYYFDHAKPSNNTADTAKGNEIGKLSNAIEFAERVGPLPRCVHGAALRDGAGEILEPPCGCTADTAKEVAVIRARHEKFCEYFKACGVAPTTAREDIGYLLDALAPAEVSGESDTAYNAEVIENLTKELIGPWERKRLGRLPTWWRSLIVELIRRIANLRRINALPPS